MKQLFETQFAIAFRKINDDYFIKYFGQLKDINCNTDIKISIAVDIDNLREEEKNILINDGIYPPEYYYYWSSLNFEISKVCNKNNYNSFWIDIVNKKYYDNTIQTCLELMTDGIRWKKNSPYLILVWGNFNQKKLFKEPITCEGFILPCYSGWGIYGNLNMENYNYLKKYFPMVG